MLLKRQSEKVDVLQKVPIFQGLSARHLRLIAREAEGIARAGRQERPSRMLVRTPDRNEHVFPGRRVP